MRPFACLAVITVSNYKRLHRILIGENQRTIPKFRKHYMAFWIESNFFVCSRYIFIYFLYLISRVVKGIAKSLCFTNQPIYFIQKISLPCITTKQIFKLFKLIFEFK